MTFSTVWFSSLTEPTHTSPLRWMVWSLMLQETPGSCCTNCEQSHLAEFFCRVKPGGQERRVMFTYTNNFMKDEGSAYLPRTLSEVSTSTFVLFTENIMYSILLQWRGVAPWVSSPAASRGLIEWSGRKFANTDPPTVPSSSPTRIVEIVKLWPGKMGSTSMLDMWHSGVPLLQMHTRTGSEYWVWCLKPVWRELSDEHSLHPPLSKKFHQKARNNWPCHFLSVGRSLVSSRTVHLRPVLLNYSWILILYANQLAPLPESKLEELMVTDIHRSCLSIYGLHLLWTQQRFNKHEWTTYTTEWSGRVLGQYFTQHLCTWRWKVMVYNYINVFVWCNEWVFPECSEYTWDLT